MIIQRVGSSIPTSGNVNKNTMQASSLVVPNASKAVRQTFSVIFAPQFNELRAYLARVSVPPKILPTIKLNLPSDRTANYHTIVGPDPEYPDMEVYFLADADNRAITILEQWMEYMRCPPDGEEDLSRTIAIEKYANTTNENAEAVGRWIYGGCVPKRLDILDDFTFQQDGQRYISLRVLIEYTAYIYQSGPTLLETDPYGVPNEN